MFFSFVLITDLWTAYVVYAVEQVYKFDQKCGLAKPRVQNTSKVSSY